MSKNNLHAKQIAAQQVDIFLNVIRDHKLRSATLPMNKDIVTGYQLCCNDLEVVLNGVKKNLTKTIIA